MVDVRDRRSVSGLRGWLSEVFLTGLVAGDSEQLARRLGDRATIDDPVFGRVRGMPALSRYLDEATRWLTARDGAFEHFGFTLGSDRDVTEGTLSLSIEGRRVAVPVAVVAERRREREVELRLYGSLKAVEGAVAHRPPPLLMEGEVIVPPPVAALLDALASGDVAAAVASFEQGGVLRRADGVALVKGEGSALQAHYEQLLSAGGSAGPRGLELVKGARADDGRTCVLEYTIVGVRGCAVPPQPGLTVFERGDNGLLRAVRSYGDVEV